MLFILAGGTVGLLTPLVPVLIEALRLSTADIGLVFAAVAVGAGCSMLVVARRLARQPARRVATVAGAGLLAVLPLLAVAPSHLALCLLGLAAGAAYGAVDLAMNVAVVELERQGGRPAMSTMHGCYSAGIAVVAGLSSLLFALGLAPVSCVAILCAVMLALLGAAHGGLGGGAIAGPSSPNASPDGSWGGSLWAVVAVAVLAMVLEGALENWMVLFLVQSGSRLPVATAIFSVFGACFAIARFTGDRLARRWSRSSLLLASGAVTLAALVLALHLAQGWIAWPAFALTGLAMGNITPLLFSSAARHARGGPAQGIAAVALGGYVALFAGPMAVGLAADHVGLGPVLNALSVVGALCAGLALLDRQSGRSSGLMRRES